MPATNVITLGRFRQVTANLPDDTPLLVRLIDPTRCLAASGIPAAALVNGMVSPLTPAQSEWFGLTHRNAFELTVRVHPYE